MTAREAASANVRRTAETKRLLLVAYYFPPQQSSASVRLGGLARYLPEFGWEPVVLTPGLPTPPDPRFCVIQTPYPGDVSARIKRRLGLDPVKPLRRKAADPLASGGGGRLSGRLVRVAQSVAAYPDEERAWRSAAVKAGARALRDHECAAILSSSGPVTAHLIARDLKAGTNLPWVADLRDLWTQNHYYQFGTLRRMAERRLERRVLSEADCLVTVSAPLAKKLSLMHPHTRTLSIPSGFDPDEVSTHAATDREFSIVYTGQLYEGRQDPSPLFRALQGLIDDGAIDASQVRVRFLGDCPRWLRNAVEQHGLGASVDFHGIVPRDEALCRQRSAQLLLLLNWDDPREAGVYTGKVFEYLAARRPILAIGGPKGVVSELLDETGAGHHITELEELKAVLVAWYGDYVSAGEVRYGGIPNELDKHTQRVMAARYAQALEEAVAHTAGQGKPGRPPRLAPPA
jgi:glycosyltransferase involved in cell wall biosynthesis